MRYIPLLIVGFICLTNATATETKQGGAPLKQRLASAVASTAPNTVLAQGGITNTLPAQAVAANTE